MCLGCSRCLQQIHVDGERLSKLQNGWKRSCPANWNSVLPGKDFQALHLGDPVFQDDFFRH